MDTAVVQKQLADKYVLSHQIGQGGYGTIYRAEIPQLAQAVAIKCVQKYANTKDMDFGLNVTVLRESAALRMLRHPGVVKLIDIVMGDTHVLFAMEICDHGDLNDYMCDMRKRGLTSMPWDTLRSFTEQLLEATAYVHSCRIAHRDIKPSNVLLKDAHTLKLCDFGMCRTICTARLPSGQALFDDPNHKYTGLCTTLGFRPPELLMSSAYASSYNPYCVDRWSLGCVIAEIILMRPLVWNTTEAESLAHIFQLFGTPTEDTWPGVSRLMPNTATKLWPQVSARQRLVRARIPPDVLAAADGLLRVSPSARMTPSSVLSLMRSTASDEAVGAKRGRVE
jgi:serine/threonine protein kinase